jgi:hypothetical protein
MNRLETGGRMLFRTPEPGAPLRGGIGEDRDG